MPTCFVIMPFGATTEQRTEDYWTRHFDRFIRPAVERAAKDGQSLGFRAYITRREAGAIVTSVLRNLQSADIVLADITDANPNVLYELGIRHTLGRQTILIIEEDQRIPFYFQNFNVINYSKQSSDTVQDFYDKIEERLAELSQEVADPVPDNPVEAFFQGSRSKVALLSEQEERTIAAMRENRFPALFTPHINSTRNERKNEAIRSAHEFVRLIAHSGHSFLAEVGHRFKDVLIGRLENQVNVQIVLLNPWTDNGLLTALGELTEDRQDRMTPLQKRAFECLQQGSLSGYDPVTLIEGSVSYRKHRESIEGYVNDFSSRPFAPHIELRLCQLELTSTVLLTEKGGFFEPYIDVNLPERHRALMNTFEIEFGGDSYLARHVQAYFNQLWKLSVSYDEFGRNEAQFKELLRAKYA